MITLSTCKAEYITLSIYFQSLIPLRKILQDIYSIFKLPFTNFKIHVYDKLSFSTTFGNNAAALAQANDGDRHYLQTKCLSNKWHHFCDQISSGWLE